MGGGGGGWGERPPREEIRVRNFNLEIAPIASQSAASKGGARIAGAGDGVCGVGGAGGGGSALPLNNVFGACSGSGLPLQRAAAAAHEVLQKANQPHGAWAGGGAGGSALGGWR